MPGQVGLGRKERHEIPDASFLSFPYLVQTPFVQGLIKVKDWSGGREKGEIFCLFVCLLLGINIKQIKTWRSPRELQSGRPSRELCGANSCCLLFPTVP